MSKPNFNIIENHKISIDEDAFVTDFYDDSMLVQDIMDKHNLSNNQYIKMKRKLGLGSIKKPVAYKLRCINSSERRYISFCPSNGRWRVTRTIKGVYRGYGSYETLEEAMDVRDLLEANDWDKSVIPSNKKPVYTEEQYFRFKQDWLDGMKYDDLLETHQISSYQYNLMSNRSKKETGLSRKPTRRVVNDTFR